MKKPNRESFMKEFDLRVKKHNGKYDLGDFAYDLYCQLDREKRN